MNSCYIFQNVKCGVSKDRTWLNELQKCRLDLIVFLTERMALGFLKFHFASWYVNQFLMIICCDEFAIQLYAMQYKMGFFKQSLSISAALKLFL